MNGVRHEFVEASTSDQGSSQFSELQEDHGNTTTYTVALPMVYHAHMDLNLLGGLYFRTAATVGLDRGKEAPRTPSQICGSLRFESRSFDIGVPVTFHQLQGMRIGLAMRLGPVMVGSDKIGGLLGLTNIGGMDVHVGLKLNFGRR